jgi:hypothetical protein
MAEHVPPRALVAMMALFLGIMAVSALAFWSLSLIWSGGLSGVMAAMGPGLTSLFAAFHIPAAVVAVLLWQWTRRDLSPVLRVALEASVLYFWGAVLTGLFFNYLAASFMGRFS